MTVEIWYDIVVRWLQSKKEGEIMYRCLTLIIIIDEIPKQHPYSTVYLKWNRLYKEYKEPFRVSQEILNRNYVRRYRDRVGDWVYRIKKRLRNFEFLCINRNLESWERMIDVPQTVHQIGEMWNQRSKYFLPSL